MSIERILVPMDFSDDAHEALRHAIALAEHHGAEIHLLHVVVLLGQDPPDATAVATPYLADAMSRMEEDAASQLRTLVADQAAGAITILERFRRDIAPGPAILADAARESIDLIVMGTHGRRGVRRFLLGSVTEEVVRQAPCPVLTVRRDEAAPRTLPEIAKIVVPYDFSDDAERALQTALELPTADTHQVDLVHVVEPPMDPDVYVPLHDRYQAYHFSALAEEVRKAMGKRLNALDLGSAPIETHVLHESAPTGVTDFAREHEADLIVIASHGLTGLRRFLLGSVTEKVLRLAHCPVLVLRHASPDGEAAEAAVVANESASDDDAADANLATAATLVGIAATNPA
ncbi:MAG: universal stress protein [Acidobacteriota bacterium]